METRGRYEVKTNGNTALSICQSLAHLPSSHPSGPAGGDTQSCPPSLPLCHQKSPPPVPPQSLSSSATPSPTEASRQLGRHVSSGPYSWGREMGRIIIIIATSLTNTETFLKPSAVVPSHHKNKTEPLFHFPLDLRKAWVCVCVCVCVCVIQMENQSDKKCLLVD